MALRVARPSFIRRSYTLQVSGHRDEVDALKVLLNAIPSYVRSVVAVDDRRGETGDLDVTIAADSAKEARAYLEKKFALVTGS